jgi:hypothetical protein
MNVKPLFYSGSLGVRTRGGEEGKRRERESEGKGEYDQSICIMKIE